MTEGALGRSLFLSPSLALTRSLPALSLWIGRESWEMSCAPEHPKRHAELRKRENVTIAGENGYAVQYREQGKGAFDDKRKSSE